MVVGVFVLSIAILSTVIIYIHESRLFQNAIGGAASFSDTIRRSTEYSMLKAENEEVHRIIDSVGQQVGVEDIRLFNKEGQVIFASDKNQLGTMVSVEDEGCSGCHSQKKPAEELTARGGARIFKADKGYRVIAMATPIYNKPQCSGAACHFRPEYQKVLGMLDVSMSLSSIDQEIRYYRLLVIGFSGFAFLVMIVAIGLFFRRLVHRPIRGLVNATRKVAQGNFDYHIPISSRDEIGQLALSFNNMTGHLKDKQHQLVRSEKLASLGKLTAGIAHELNNPLTRVLAYSKLLAGDAPDGSELKKDLEVIVAETMRIREIIKELLGFARAEEPERKILDINQVITETVSLLKYEAALHEVAVKVHLDSKLPPIKAAPGQMKQVFINIIVNACQATKPGGSLTITSKLDGQGKFIVIDFTDTGYGIDVEHLNRIFDPFFSTKEQRMEVEEGSGLRTGTGLGLAVSYGIIEMHGGTIEVKSEVGKGSTFTVKLPVVGS